VPWCIYCSSGWKRRLLLIRMEEVVPGGEEGVLSWVLKAVPLFRFNSP